LARRARMARRVGSAKAEKAALRFEAPSISDTLYKYRLIVKKKFSPPARVATSLPGQAIGDHYSRYCFGVN
jgi:hypothetical protein